MTRAALLIAAAAALAAGVGPASAAATDFEDCAARISSNQFWRDLRVDGVTCIRGAEIARPWVRRYGRQIPLHRPRNPQHLLGWTCRLEVLRGEFNPYGRVTCRKGKARIRFYGYS